jgi:AraC family transcriptional regulator
MMNNVIDQIEEDISLQITLQSLSKQFFLSEFHFSRLFKFITGINLKQYVLGRKLSLAGEKLKETDTSVTDVAYDYGFKYPEVFSRAFKKQFGMSPAAYKKGEYDLHIISKASVTDRDIKNYKGELTLKETFIYLDTLYLYGTYIEVNENDADFEHTLRIAGETFAAEVGTDCKQFYSVVNCHGDESGNYTVFFGEKALTLKSENTSDIRKIPAGWYAQFFYHGDMPDMRNTFTDDLYSWMVIKEIQPCSNGIGMINIFNRNDIENIAILIPIKEPK